MRNIAATKKKHPALVLALAIPLALATSLFFEISQDSRGSDAAISTAWGDVIERSDKVANVVAQALPSVVNISSTKLVSTGTSPVGSFGNRGARRLGKSLGSGVIVSNKGYVLTNNHVVSNARDITVGFSDGRELSAKVVGADPNSDLAVLKLEGRIGRLIPMRLGDSSKMRLGETVLAIGNPFGVGQTVTMGIVSAKGRANMGILDYEDFIQTDAAINPGNSGGALINLRGELIGINTAILSRTGGSQGIGFAIPTDIAKPIMRSIIKTGKVSRGFLGVTIQTVNDELIEALKLSPNRGVLVSDIVKQSPAAKAGLHRNDVVLRINGRRVKTSAQFRTKIASLGAGAKVKLSIMRGSRTLDLNGTLKELPSGGRRATATQGRGGRPTRLGVAVAPLSSKLRQTYHLDSHLDRGVVVTRIADNSRAAEIGLQPGDVILEVNRREVSTAKEFKSAYKRSGNRLALLVYRNGSAVYIVVSK